jgi:hypothetical protein
VAQHAAAVATQRQRAALARSRSKAAEVPVVESSRRVS